MINPNCYETTTRGNAPLVSPSPACGERETSRFRSSPRRALQAKDPPSLWGSRARAHDAKSADRTAPVGQDLHPRRAEHPVWGCRGLGLCRPRARRALSDLSEALAEAPVVRTATESARLFAKVGGSENRGLFPTRWPSLMPKGTSGVGASRPLLASGAFYVRGLIVLAVVMPTTRSADICAS